MFALLGTILVPPTWVFV